MAEEGFSTSPPPAGSAGLSWRHLLFIGFLALLVGAVLLYLGQRRGREKGGIERERVTTVPQRTRTATLFFAKRDEEGLAGETRQVAVGEEISEEVRGVVQALLEGPESGAVSPIPPGTKLLDAFYEPDSAVVYLDFSGELVAGHPGGSAAEYYTIAAIIRTIAENFPQVRGVQILVEGYQVGTIGGHIDADGPFWVEDWR